MWVWRKGNMSLCYSIVYYYNGAQRYEQFLQVGRLCWALILLGLPMSSCVFSLHGAVYIYFFKKFCLHPFLYLLVSWAWWDWPLTWLTNHCPSVLWHCWLGHVKHKIVFEITYNVSSGTLNPTTAYHTTLLWVTCHCSLLTLCHLNQLFHDSKCKHLHTSKQGHTRTAK